MFGKLVNNLVDGATAKFKQFQNKSFMEAVVAACVLVASADGTIEPSEKKKLMGAMRNSEELKYYEADQVLETFTKFANKIDLDEDFGKAELLGIVAKADPSEKAQVVAVAVMIAKANGNIDKHEEAVIQEIKANLGLV